MAKKLLELYYPFESLLRRQLRKLKALSGQGDEFGPYNRPLAQASADGATGAVSVADGEPQLFLVDEVGRLFVRTTGAAGGAQLYTSAALEASAVVKASPGTVSDVRMLVTTGIAAARWLMLFDRITVPVLGTAPVWRALLPNPGAAVAEVSDSFAESLEFATGIAIGISTTEVTYTAAGAEALFSVGYQ